MTWDKYLQVQRLQNEVETVKENVQETMRMNY